MRQRGELPEEDQDTQGATVYEVTESESSSAPKGKEEKMKAKQHLSKAEELRLS